MSEYVEVLREVLILLLGAAVQLDQQKVESRNLDMSKKELAGVIDRILDEIKRNSK